MIARPDRLPALAIEVRAGTRPLMSPEMNPARASSDLRLLLIERLVHDAHSQFRRSRTRVKETHEALVPNIVHEGGHFSFADTHFAIETDFAHREGAILHDKVELHGVDARRFVGVPTILHCLFAVVESCLCLTR